MDRGLDVSSLKNYFVNYFNLIWYMASFGIGNSFFSSQGPCLLLRLSNIINDNPISFHQTSAKNGETKNPLAIQPTELNFTKKYQTAR